ncbi:MAG: hypothetical protein JW395_3979 [Nitrospira sp.]|nr:hypothetical protein [Nitrospira sp.]
MARLEIFFPVLLLAFQVAGQSQDFDIACERIVAAGPDAIIGDVLVGIRQDGNNLLLEFRCELCPGSREHFCRRRRRRDRLVCDKWPAEQDIHVEQPFAIQRLCDVVAGLLYQALFLFGERGALFSPDDEEAVGSVAMQKRHPEQGLRARRNQTKANGASSLLITRGRRCRDGRG